MSDKVTVEISPIANSITVAPLTTSVEIINNTTAVEVTNVTTENNISQSVTNIDIVPSTTTVEATTNITTVDISPNTTTVGVGDASIVASSLASTIHTSHGESSWITGGNVQASFENLATTADSRYVNVAGDTMTGDLTVPRLKVEKDNGTAVITLHDSTDDDDHIIYLTGMVANSPENLFSLGTRPDTNQFQLHSYLDRNFEFTFGNSREVDPVATISTSGLDVAGTITFDGGTTSDDIHFGDDDKALFGPGNELKIYHSANNQSYIHEVGSGDLNILATNLKLQDADENTKVLVNSTGINVTGTATATAFSGPLTGNVTGQVSDLSNHDTDDLTEGTNKYFTTARFNTAFDGKTTTDLTEGANKYYTDAKVDARILNAIKDEDNMGSNSATHVPSQQSVKAYVDTEVAGLVNGAPDDLNTLHELADALAEDANFSATITNSIGNKLAKAQNLADLANAETARTNLGLGTAAVLDFDLEYSSLNNKPTLYSDSAVDTHLNQSTAANNEVLSWNGSDYDWVANEGGIALTDISVSETEGTASGDGGISYNSTSGVFTYTPPDLAPFQTPENQYITVNSGAGVVAGHPYIAFGWDTDSELITVASPDSDGAGQMPIIGFAVETVTNNTVTKLLTFGVIKDHNTNQYTAFGTLASADSTFVDAASDTIYFTNSEADNFVHGDRVQLEVGVESNNPQGEDFPVALPHITEGEWFVRKTGTLSHNGNFYQGFRFYKELSDCLLANSNYRTFESSDVTDISGESVYLRNIEETKYLFASPAQGKLRRSRPKLANNDVQQVATILNYGTSTGAILVDIGNPEPTDVLDSFEFRYNSGTGVQKADFRTALKNISGIGQDGDFLLEFHEYPESTYTPKSKFSTAIHSDTVNMNPASAPDPGYSIVFGDSHDYKGFNNAVFGQENTITATNAANIFGGYQNETTAAANDRNLVVGLSNTLAGGVVDTVITGDNNILNNTARGVIFGQNNANAYSVGSIVGGKNAVARASHQSITVGADNFGATTNADIPNICMWNGGQHTALFGKSNSAGLATDGSLVCGEQNRLGATSFTHYQLQPGNSGSTKQIPYAGGAMPVEPARRSFIAGSHNVLTAASWSAAIGHKNKCASDKSFVLGANNEVGTAGGNHIQGLLGLGLLSPQHSGGVNIGQGQIVVGSYNDRSDFDSKLRSTPKGGWYLNNKHCFSVGTGSGFGQRETAFVIVPRQEDSTNARDFCGIAMPALVGTASYANDAAAEQGGVPVGGLYHTSGTIKIRLS